MLSSLILVRQVHTWTKAPQIPHNGNYTDVRQQEGMMLILIQAAEPPLKGVQIVRGIPVRPLDPKLSFRVEALQVKRTLRQWLEFQVVVSIGLQ